MHLGLLALADATVHEKSKTAFYITGGLLAAWAVGASFLSFSRPDFPGSPERTRGVMGISIALVAATIAAAALTASTPAPAPAYSVHGGGTQKGTAPPPTPAPPGGGGVAAAAPAPAQATGGGPAATGGKLTVAADQGGQLKFDKTSLSAKAGKVMINFINASPVPHNLTIDGAGATPTFTGGSRSLVATLKPGTYQFYCSVPGHRQAGMQGTLTVA